MASGFADAANAIRKKFSDDWKTGGLERTKVAWDNGTLEPTAGTAWVRLSVLDGDATQQDIANKPRIRHVGVVVVEIYTPIGKLDGANRTYADLAAAIFRRVTLTTTANDKVVFRAPEYRRIGEEGPWYHGNVTIDFYRDSIFT